MKFKSEPVTKPTRRRNHVWRSCPVYSGLEWKQYWTPEAQLTRSMRRLETGSSDSEPVPGPSGLSQTSHAALGSDGRVLITKRELEDTCEMEQQASPTKRSRSKSPRREKSNIKTLACASADKGEGPSLVEFRAPWDQPSELPIPPPIPDSTETMTKEQAAQTLNDLYAKYKVIKHLCDGGFGVIYVGARIEDDFPVAIKTILKNWVPYTEMEVNGAMCSLPLEVSLIIRVGAGPDSSSSNITPLLLDWYDLGCEIVMVMERPEPCMDLLGYVTNRGEEDVKMEDVRSIFRQLVEAAIEMKAKGVFHRDIKPDNVLIETGGEEIRARFIDFGCGTTFTPGQIFYEPQGTIQYAAPEFFRHSPYTEGPVTVWQLGILLYVLLFSRRPLVNERTIGSWQIVPIPTSVPEECRHLLKSCLWKDPEDRVSLEKRPMLDNRWKLSQVYDNTNENG